MIELYVKKCRYFEDIKLAFILSGKIEVLNDYGEFLLRKDQTEKAEENFKRALKLARASNDKKPHITLAVVLNNLGGILGKTGKPDESLRYLVQAKETMDKLARPNNSHPLTSCILNNMETSYYMLVHLSNVSGCKDNCYKQWMVVYVLVALIKKYAKKGSIFDCIMFYLDARQIAKSLPKEDSLPDSTLEMLKLMEI